MDLRGWVDHCSSLRGRVVKREDGENSYLLASLAGTAQQKDIEARTPLIDDFFRVKINVKAFEEAEMAKKGRRAIDFHDNEAVFGALREEFDIPYWAFVKLANSPLRDLTRTFIYQLKACNIHCPWCYVEDKSRDGKRNQGARFFSVPEIVDVFEGEREEQPLHAFRPSGGEPTLAVEQWLESLREFKKRGIKDVFVQGDTNLTTGHFINRLEDNHMLEGGLLHNVGEYDNFGLLCSFKGTDEQSFLRASGMPIRMAFLEHERWYSFGKFLEAGIDAYPFVYNPNPATLPAFMEKGARLFGEGFYLKTWIVPLKLYGPEKERLTKQGLNSEQYQQQLNREFQQSKEVMQDLIWKKFGVNYQAIPRTGIKLKT
jgi:hypothetical protein